LRSRSQLAYIVARALSNPPKASETFINNQPFKQTARSKSKQSKKMPSMTLSANDAPTFDSAFIGFVQTNCDDVASTAVTSTLRAAPRGVPRLTASELAARIAHNLINAPASNTSYSNSKGASPSAAPLAFAGFGDSETPTATLSATTALEQLCELVLQHCWGAHVQPYRASVVQFTAEASPASLLDATVDSSNFNPGDDGLSAPTTPHGRHSEAPRFRNYEATNAPVPFKSVMNMGAALKHQKEQQQMGDDESPGTASGNESPAMPQLTAHQKQQQRNTTHLAVAALRFGDSVTSMHLSTTSLGNPDQGPRPTIGPLSGPQAPRRESRARSDSQRPSMALADTARVMHILSQRSMQQRRLSDIADPRRVSIGQDNNRRVSMGLNRIDSVASMAGCIPAEIANHADVQEEAWDGTAQVNQYVLLQTIGSGAQGDVMLAMDTDKNELRAVKVMPRGGAGSITDARGRLNRRMGRMQKEVAIMKKCRHRNIVALYEVIDDPAANSLYLVMQYVEHGSLVSLNADGSVTQAVAPDLLAGYARQLCAGLHYLHNHGVIHRDVKPDNMLLGNDNQVFLSDFGVSDVFEMNNGGADISGTRGTKAFLAPEMWSAVQSGDAVDGKAVDVWAMGLTLYTLLYGKLPWRCVDAAEYEKLISTVPPPFPRETPCKAVVGELWITLLEGMLQRDATKRWKMPAVREHTKKIHRQLAERDEAEALRASNVFTAVRHLSVDHASAIGSPRPTGSPRESLSPRVSVANRIASPKHMEARMSVFRSDRTHGRGLDSAAPAGSIPAPVSASGGATPPRVSLDSTDDYGLHEKQRQSLEVSVSGSGEEVGPPMRRTVTASAAEITLRKSESGDVPIGEVHAPLPMFDANGSTAMAAILTFDDDDDDDDSSGDEQDFSVDAGSVRRVRA
jgi:serine/threonine protein kinase